MSNIVRGLIEKSRPRPVSLKDSEYNSLVELSQVIFGDEGYNVSKAIRFLDNYYRSHNNMLQHSETRANGIKTLKQ